MLRAWVMAACAGLCVGLGGGACRVPNRDHCANQDVPGDRYCRETTPSLPYCSPCRRKFDGCVEFPPVGCAGYDVETDPEASESSSAGSSSDEPDEGTSTTAADGG
jgi:hypothetical protein